jgi:selT/selW/selH-like putative selenoprotein
LFESRLQADVRLIASDGGVFEVTVDGRLLHSKKACGNFPDDQQLVESLL